MIALLVTVREKNPFIKSGYIKTTDVMSVLKDPRLPVEFIPQVIISFAIYTSIQYIQY